MSVLEFPTDYAAHTIVKTRLCKIAGCVDDARDARGRFAGLCDHHKLAAIAQARADGTWGGRRPGSPQSVTADGELVASARALARQARRVERAKTALDRERHELRKIYLRFGVEAALPRRPLVKLPAGIKVVGVRRSAGGLVVTLAVERTVTVEGSQGAPNGASTTGATS